MQFTDNAPSTKPIVVEDNTSSYTRSSKNKFASMNSLHLERMKLKKERELDASPVPMAKSPSNKSSIGRASSLTPKKMDKFKNMNKLHMEKVKAREVSQSDDKSQLGSETASKKIMQETSKFKSMN